jgi:hypothetical protein
MCPSICNDDGFPVGEHDARCETWVSNDPDTCDCRDSAGHSPLETAAPPITTHRPAHTVLPCDTDPEDEAS